MAREDKRVELKPVDDTPEPEVAVIRLESDETRQRAKPVRLGVPETETGVSQRLDVPAREEYETRTHQPGIEALIENEAVDPNFLEQDWGSESTRHKSTPWGWFVLIGLILASGAIWSLSGVKKSEVKAAEIRVAADTSIDQEAKEELEASQLIDRMEAVTRKFFATTSVDALARLSRHPERVRPLMESYYGGKPIPPQQLTRPPLLQPLTMDNRANFWMGSVDLADKTKRNLIIEILGDGEPRIDWETLVCYQPMKWDTFATERPAGKSMDFRVSMERDNFFSHEFADATQWNCFRLTALNSDETLFGYTKVGDEISNSLLALIQQNRGRRTAVILRLNIPEGIQSRRGVVIEKMLSPRWLYINPPAGG